MTGLLARNDSSLSVSLKTEGREWQARVLELAALIGRVNCAEEQQAAVDADKALTEFINEVESSRVAIKEPVLNCGRTIDETAKKAVTEALEERQRVRKLIGDFQALELKKIRAAQAAENDRLTELERERQQALSQAKSHEQLDAVNSEFDQRTREEALPPVTPIRAEGQIVHEGWQFEVVDVWALALAHPNCVKEPEVKRLEVKSLLDSGLRVVGVRAWKEIKSSVRVEKTAIMKT